MILLKLIIFFVFVDVLKGDDTIDEDEKEFEREIDPLRYHEKSASVRLEEDLLRNYDPNQIPRKNPKSAIEIGVLPVIQHLTVNQKEQNIVVLITYFAEWQDDNLSWDPKKYDNLTTLILPSSKVWQPKLIPQHLRDSQYWMTNPEFDEFVTIEMRNQNQTATVLMQYRYNMKVDCNFDFEDYPNDINQCTISVHFMSDAVISTSFRNSPQHIDLAFSKYGRKEIVNEFRILNLTLNEVHTIVQMVPFLDTTVTFQRHAPHFFAVFTIPTLMCSLFNTLSFLAPTIIHSIFISFSTLVIEFIFMKDYISKLPPTVDSLPKCVQLYSFIMFSTFLILVIHFVSIWYYQRQPSRNAPKLNSFWSRILPNGVPMFKVIRTFMSIALSVMYSILICEFLFLN